MSSALVRPHSEGQNPVATNSLTAADCTKYVNRKYNSPDVPIWK
jgi:hypothetical protein